jgi:hypothetical protein
LDGACRVILKPSPTGSKFWFHSGGFASTPEPGLMHEGHVRRIDESDHRMIHIRRQADRLDVQKLLFRRNDQVRQTLFHLTQILLILRQVDPDGVI